MRTRTSASGQAPDRDLHRRDPVRPNPFDLVGNALVTIGGGITILALSLLVLGMVGFGLMFAIGFSEHPGETSADAAPVFLSFLGGVVGCALLAGVTWLKAIRGRTWALALMLLLGTGATWFVLRTWVGWQSGLDRAEDRAFLTAFVAIAMAPISLTAGALMRLVVRLRGRASAPPHRRL